jgi:hypothetical protein
VTARAEFHRDRDLGRLQDFGRRVGAFVVRNSRDEQIDVSDRDRRPIEHEGRAGATGRGDQPAPIRIAAIDGGLDERGIRDGPRGEPRVGRRCGAGDTHRDELGGALAAAHDLAREMSGHLAQRFDQPWVIVFRRRRRRLAGGEQEDAVIRGALAVHGDRVEALVRNGA